jgi:hypothetical protein
MKFGKILLSLLLLLLFTGEASFSQRATELRVDPLLLVSLKECRNITKTLGKELFPGWDFQQTPVLFYRPNVQELLINFPHKPKGFSEYHGFNPLGNETVYFRNDTTLITLDDQNTSSEIEGIPVLVVADPLSRMRNQLRGVVTLRPKEYIINWLNGWSFVRSPYDELELILHEAFHVYQHRKAPEKQANEMIVSQYPLLDPVNNALYVLEGSTLKDALLTQDSAQRLEKIKQFVAVRGFRQSRLKSNWVEYENMNEYSEGLAKYVEYKFLRLGEGIKPVKEMSFRNGFNGYSGVLARIYQDRLEDMVDIVAVNDDRFGNRFGAGPLRFKLYELGACQAMLLDEIMPSWKEKIFNKDVFLTGLLKESVSLSPIDLERYLERAKSEYHYSEAYDSKLRFEKEGKEKIQEQLAAILQTDKTLVKISYEGFAEKLGLGYTPFGVTQVSERSAIYDLMPLKVVFKAGVELQMKQVIPVFIDREKKLIAFAVTTPVSKFGTGVDGKIETDEFRLATTKMDVVRQANAIAIQLK